MRALTRSSSASAATALPAPAGASPSARSARDTSPFRPATSPWRGPPAGSVWGACLQAGSLHLVRLHACGRLARQPVPPRKRLARCPRGCRTAAALPLQLTRCPSCPCQQAWANPAWAAVWASLQLRHQVANKRRASTAKVLQHSASSARQAALCFDCSDGVHDCAAARRGRGERAHVQVRDFLHCSRDALQRAAAVRLQRGVHILRCQVHMQLQVRKVPAR